MECGGVVGPILGGLGNVNCFQMQTLVLDSQRTSAGHRQTPYHPGWHNLADNEQGQLSGSVMAH